MYDNGGEKCKALCGELITNKENLVYHDAEIT